MKSLISRRMANLPTAILLTCSILLFSCAKKKEEVVIPPQEPVRVDNRTFSSPEWAEQYRRLIPDFRSLYEPPRTGLVFRVELRDGSVAVGQLLEVAVDSIVLKDKSGPFPIAWTNLAESSRALFYAEDFARYFAGMEVDAEQLDNAQIPPLLADFIIASTGEVQETRYTAGEDIEVRLGPDRAFKRAPGVELLRGENVYVVTSRNDWICFKRKPDNGRASLWAQRYSTVPLDDANVAQRDADIAALQARGLLASIDPHQNDAQVDLDRWLELDPLVQKGMGRTMAFYCGDKKGTHLYWVEIRDAKTGKKLARYSESQGFKIY